MTDRVISVRLRIAVAEARRDAKAAADAIRGIADAAERAGQSTAGLTRLGAAAKAAATATATVGTVAVGGIAAMTAATLKGGIAYNTLEQTSRAALKTVLGSAAAATDQMEALREFGKTSPFPRQVWISAQQQLLAFGMSAEKIIPTFQAIQDAVAAAGGSSQTISEITTILAKIQSTGKVTAEELNELGYRGIDAASLIGEAMGKTAGEVRADITAQAISGVQFIDMLTGAMSQRFSGAAEGVKATWAGATDRVKGAIRDVGGLLATPLVDPEGGGAAVDWANSIADALRALEARLVPAMAALRERAEPALQALNDKLQDLAEWIRTADFGAIAEKLAPMLPAIAGVTAGLVTMGARSLPVIGGMVSGLKPLPVALLAAAAASPELRQALFDLVEAAQPLLAAVGDSATMLMTALGPALTAVAALLQPVIMVVQVLGDVLGALPGPIQAVVGGLLLFKGLQMAGALGGITTAFTNFRSEMDAQRKSAAMAGTQVTSMGAAYSVAATKVSGAAVGIRGALSSAVGFLGGPWGAAIGTGVGLLAMFSTATDDAVTDQQGLADALEAGTGAITDQTREWVLNKLTTTGVGDIYRKIGGDLNDLVDAYLGVPGATEKVNAAFAGYGRAVEEGTNKTSLSADEMRKLRDFLNSAAPAMDSAKAAAKAKANADRDGANAAGDAAAANAGLAGAMYGVGDAADSVATRTQQLSQILSAFNDSQFASQEASDGFQSKLHALKGAFASNDKASTKSAASNNQYTDALKRQAKIARDTQKQLLELAEAQREAEREAAEAARAARQRQLDELFGKTFNVDSTLDAFQSALAQAAKDLQEGAGVAGSRSLLGFTEGALANRERMRGIVQAAQAAIQAERDSGASGARIGQVSGDLADQLAQQATAWGLNAAEVKQYTDAIRAFGNLAGQEVAVDLSTVTQEYAKQRQEIEENSAEQMENARESANTASAARDAAGAVNTHTATLKGNSESAIKNREMMRGMVKAAQDEMTQLHLSGASKEELTRKGEALATQLENEAIQLGFTREDVALYTESIRISAGEIAKYPVLTARADVAGAMTTVTNFVKGVNEELAKIERNLQIGVTTGSEYINSMGGGRMFLADGGFVSGPGGPREDKVRAMLSNGEFVVNAKDTARTRPLLEAINSGQGALGFADGGYVDPINLTYFGNPIVGLQETFGALQAALMPFAALSQGPLAWAASQVGKPYIWGGVGPAGYDCCLVPGTMVYGPDGATPIQDVRPGNRVYSYVDGKLAPQTVTAAWQSKRQPVFRVRTRNRAVVGSANHPFLKVVQIAPARHVKGGRRGEQVPAKFDVQWARLDELRPGDLLVQPRQMPTAVKPDPVLSDGTAVTADVAWLIGAAVGDGTVTSKALRLCLYGEKRARADRIARQLWACNPMHGDGYGMIICNAALARALRDMGMRRLGPDKRVPDAVWHWAPELQRAFLDGYCDADGHRPASQARHGERTYSSCSRRLIDDVRALHIMLGDAVSNVATNKRTKPIAIKGKQVKKARPLHMFAVWRSARDGEAVTRRRPGLAALLDSGDFTFARVLSVTDEGEQDTYDLEVEGAHNFVADGIVVHNSGFMSAITNVIQGKGPHARRFATGSFPTGDFVRGPGNYMIGSVRGNPGHMAGTLMGVNVESRGGDGVVMGKKARGAFDSLFGGNIWHLKGYADGGLVTGDPPFDLISPLGKHFDEMVKGSYATGTDYVPMDGLYELHRGEAVTPAAQNSGGVAVVEIRSDGSKFGDLVVDALNRADSTGQIRFVRR